MFPPALVPILRETAGNANAWLNQVSDEVLEELVSVTFFAGLERYEAERHPVRVVFSGATPAEAVPSDPPAGGVSDVPATYRWKALRFNEPRPFSVRELTKLTVAADEERIYTMVQLVGGVLAITGLAREGGTFEGDPFIKLIVPKPGGLSVRSGRERLLEYEHGSVISFAEDLLLAEGVVRTGLEEIARRDEVDRQTVPDYLYSIQAIVREMAAHGYGGILVVSPEHDPDLPTADAYHLAPHASLASLLKLSHLLNGAAGQPGGRRDLLRSAFLTEITRTIEEIGALTAIDGAAVLNPALALIGFGVTLPVSGEMVITEAADPHGQVCKPYDVVSRGTRHRAAATYANRHPGAVVFVASEDGPVTCFFRRMEYDAVLAWRLA
jgi:hypothetical protein